MISWSNSAMDNERLEQLIEHAATICEGKQGFWRINYREQEMYVITDESHNRMRVMCPIIECDSLDEETMGVLLHANFDRALDAKFAMSQGFLWSVYMHPLRELTDDQFFDALDQVKTLAANYGTSYSSSNLHFGS